MLIGTLCSETGAFAVSITAATTKPVRLEFPSLPGVEELRTRIHEGIPDALYFEDVYGTPAYRKRLTLQFADEIRRELSVDGDR